MADWQDFDALRHQIKSNTVDKLKHIANGLNELCAAHIIKSGKKQDLIERIADKMDTWRRSGSVEKWSRAKTVFQQVRENGVYIRAPTLSTASPVSSIYNSRPQSLNAYATSAGPSKTAVSVNGFSTHGITQSSIAKYDPYAPPRKAVPTSPVVPQSTKQPGIRFKSSPFFRIEQQISSVVECPESTGTMDRRSQTVNFGLCQEHINKLSSESPAYQLRLYCTSSNFYFHSPNAFRTSASPCPIEFPPTCEVRVNGTPLTANLKGLKKKPGTAPPAELGRNNLRLDTSSHNNKVEMVYVNSQQPVQAKKYYLVVFLVEVTTVDQLVDRIRKGKYKNADDVKQTIFGSSSDDDDIVFGPQKLSLRCPLTYVRIKDPCRSSYCVHPQCFDAHSWYTMMEQTTTWLCPVCEKPLNSDDLIIDGYFDSILKATPEEDVDDVLVEADGEWHTYDNTHASTGWRNKHPSSHVQSAVVPVKKALGSSCSTGTSIPSSSQAPQQVVSLCESDEEEEAFVKRELSISNPGLPTTPEAQHTSTVIDLTLDSDSDGDVGAERAIPIPENSRKRRISEVSGSYDTQTVSQRVRVETAYTQPNANEPYLFGVSTMNGYDAMGGFGIHCSDVLGDHQSMSYQPTYNPHTSPGGERAYSARQPLPARMPIIPYTSQSQYPLNHPGDSRARREEWQLGS